VYFEEARAAWWRNVAGREGLDGVDYILAEATLRYHARVLWPQELRVGVRLARLTRKTFDLDYEVRSEQGRLLVSGRTVQVMYDYDAGASMPVPQDVRDALEAHEGPFGRRGYPEGDADLERSL
jgi:acyl-CoA thioester hydrolase